MNKKDEPFNERNESEEAVCFDGEVGAAIPLQPVSHSYLVVRGVCIERDTAHLYGGGILTSFGKKGGESAGENIVKETHSDGLVCDAPGGHRRAAHRRRPSCAYVRVCLR
jgi:hypothetical protein